jgi:hypothetical protein
MKASPMKNTANHKKSDYELLTLSRDNSRKIRKIERTKARVIKVNEFIEDLEGV